MSDNVRSLPTCEGKKADGSKCERIIGPSSTYCYAHDPARAEERAKNSSTAAKSKPAAEIAEVKRQIKGLLNKMLTNEVNPKKASVAAQLFGVLLRAFEIEHKVVNMEELKAQVAEAKEIYEQHGYGAGSW